MARFGWSWAALMLAVVCLVVVSSAPGTGGQSTSASTQSRAGVHAGTPMAVTPLTPAPVAPPTQSSVAATPSIGTAVLDSLRAHHIPMQDVYLPNLNPRITPKSAVVTPLYTNSPAPMGVADFGIQNFSGMNEGTILNTASVEGIANFSSLHAFYIDSTTPDALGVQLNTVLNHVTLFGKSTYEFWNQNVVTYTTETHQLSFLDNIWNFSSLPVNNFVANSLYSYNGTIVATVFYFDRGPTFTVTTPFTLRLFTNSSVVQNRPAVFFNYSLTSGGVTHAGSYDRVLFNSSALLLPPPAPAPYYQINGKAANPTGYLLNDAELVIGGPGGGSTVSLSNINGRMQLFTWNNTSKAYDSVKSAFGYGTDTGETVEGVTEWWAPLGSTPTAYLNTGPSFLDHLWGLNATRSGFLGFNLTLTPANAFLFGAPANLYTVADSAWAPVNTSGSNYYQLYPGSYTFRVLLSDYAAQTIPTFNASTNTVVTLVRNTLDGVYTPLWATGNSQLSAIATSGSGTVGSPYVVFNNQNTTLDQSFGELNDFFFPVFPGVLFIGTSAYVSFTSPASLFISYPNAIAGDLQSQGLPVYNYLQYQFYNSSHITIWQAPLISGWLSSNLDFFFTLASVMFWNCSYDLVGRSTFQDTGSALLFYNGIGNRVWNNTFVETVPTSGSSGNLYQAIPGAGIAGLTLGGSGDLVYNNFFNVAVPASMLGIDLYSGAPTSYNDTWNVSLRAASVSLTMNGHSLSGNVLGLNYQGGSYWSNYGLSANPYGVLPFTDQGPASFGFPFAGPIYKGGDFIPLVPFHLYTITFTQSGLSAGTSWNVSFNGLTRGATTASITFLDPNGSYPFVVTPITGYQISPTSGVLAVSGAGPTQVISFTKGAGTYSVTFTETGLGSGTPWNTTLGLMTQTTYTTSISFVEPNGSYQFTVSAPSYSASPSVGTIVVNGAAVPKSVTFTVALGTLSGTVAPATATLTIDGSGVSVSSGSFSVSVAPGVHSLVAKNLGYYAYFNNASVTSGKTTSVTISLDVAPTVPSGTLGNISGTVTPVNAVVSVNGTVAVLTGGAFKVALRAGVYSVVATSSGYYPFYNNVTVVAGQTTSLTIRLNSVAGATTQSPATDYAPVYDGLVIAGVLIAAGAIVAGLLLRKPKRSEPIRPASTPESPSPKTEK